MRVAVLVKQVPRFEDISLGEDGRLRRDGLDAELNPFCRRAVAKGVEVAEGSRGECVVFTLGPEQAEDALREAIAWGATRGVHICDPAFAASDTLATARALAAAIRAEGPFDLVLAGRNSVDAETGQVGPQIAQLLGLPMLAGVREIHQLGDAATGQATVEATCERDDGYTVSTTRLPAVLTTAERLCDPAKVPPEGRAQVSADRIKRYDAAALGDGPWGRDGSPTWVGEVRVHQTARARLVLSGPLETQVAEAVRKLETLGLLDALHTARTPSAGVPVPRAGERTVAVLVEAGNEAPARELIGRAAELAAADGGSVTALVVGACADARLSGWGADQAVVLDGSTVEEDVAAALCAWCDRAAPWAVLLPATTAGREIGARLAAALGLGLTGDAVELSRSGDRLVAWKPALGGQALAAVTSESAIQLATVRPGVLPLLAPRPPAELAAIRLPVPALSRTAHLKYVREDDVAQLERAAAIVCVGFGVPPDGYPLVAALQARLGAELAGTRKVTDRGWLPRARQIGITGRAVSPRLAVSIGASGKFNHVVGMRQAEFVLAINNDPDALVFQAADLGLVGDWREAVRLLTSALPAA